MNAEPICSSQTANQGRSTAALESIEQIYQNFEQSLSYNCLTKILLKALKHGYKQPKAALIYWLPTFIASVSAVSLSWIYLGADPKNPDMQFPAAIGPTVCSTPFILLSGAGLIGSALGQAKNRQLTRLNSQLENVETAPQDSITYRGYQSNI